MSNEPTEKLWVTALKKSLDRSSVAPDSPRPPFSGNYVAVGKAGDGSPIWRVQNPNVLREVTGNDGE
jgi:hypothetical protein